MGILHRAYTFSPGHLCEVLDSRVVDNGQMRTDALRDWACLVVAGGNETTQTALNDLRFDDYWLSRADADLAQTERWFLIILAEALRPALSLSHRVLGGYGLLERTLPLVDWSNSEIELLTRGRPLHTLIESFGNHVFLKAFRRIDQYGGWLSPANAEQLLARLRAVQHDLELPDTRFGPAPGGDPPTPSATQEEMLLGAYSDAQDMLHSAAARQEALLMMLN